MASFGDEFRLTLVTNDPVTALHADAAGVDRIGIDLERLGKAERQAGRDSRLSAHTVDDLALIARSVAHAQVFARTNPIHPKSRAEIESLLEAGCDVLMLPNFQTANEVAEFIEIVQGRARIMILIESTAALTRIREILSVPGVDEVMVGLNDLHLQLRVSNHFEVLASPLLDLIANEVSRRGLPWSVGGVGRADDDSLPVPADLVHAQYPRLGATGAWLARSFMKVAPVTGNLRREVRLLRDRLTEWAAASPESLERAREGLAIRARGWTPASIPVAKLGA